MLLINVIYLKIIFFAIKYEKKFGGIEISFYLCSAKRKK